jgi:plasmid stability protein
MALSMVPILIHSDAVPAEARNALKASLLAPPERRGAALETAARVLHREAGLDCADARILVGLPQTGSCR